MTFRRFRFTAATATLFAVSLGGCSLAPVYQAPTVAIATDAWTDNPWQSAKPADDLPHGAWWHVFGDPTLGTRLRQR